MPTAQETAQAQEIDEVQRALDEARKRFPPAPEVDRIDWWLYIDSTGDDAVQITVVLQDPPDKDLYSLPELAPIQQAIVETFRERGIERWAYVGFSLKSELDAPEGEDDDDGEPRVANG